MTSSIHETDLGFMQQAIACAEEAARGNEVPVGAVLVLNDEVIASGFNQPITNHDPSAHAEIVAIRAAANALKNYRLLDNTLYVTLEPCLMCVGAIVHARIHRLVFGAYDPKAGAVSSITQAFDFPQLNHQVAYEGGVMQNECSALLKAFFQERR